MKPRNKEDVKPFDLLMAKAGHPYGQKCLKPARIGIWDANDSHYKLVGVLENDDGKEESAEWSEFGTYDVECQYTSYQNLVLWPLGYCQDKPVFAGDVLINGGGGEFEVCIGISQLILDTCGWPRKEPVMPKVKAEVREDRLSLMQAGITHMLCNQQDEVIDYLVDSGKVVRVQS